MNGAQDIRKWAEETAAEIAEECESEEERRDRLHETVDGCADVIYTAKAWDVVNAARQDSQLYDQAYESLTDTTGDRIGDGEDINNVIVRTAYWVLFYAGERALQEIEEATAS